MGLSEEEAAILVALLISTHFYYPPTTAFTTITLALCITASSDYSHQYSVRGITPWPSRPGGNSPGKTKNSRSIIGEIPHHHACNALLFGQSLEKCFSGANSHRAVHLHSINNILVPRQQHEPSIAIRKFMPVNDFDISKRPEPPRTLFRLLPLRPYVVRSR